MSFVAALATIDVATALAALVLAVALAVWRDWFRRRGRARWAGASGSGVVPPRRIVVGGRTVLIAAAGAAVAGAAILSAWQDEPSRRASGPAPAAIVFALDVSRSMEAGDVAPNRLAAARALIAQLVSESAPGAVGLVVFAGEAELTCPLTSDLDAMRMALEEVPAAAAALVGGSAIGDALARSETAFTNARSRKIVVLLTDGERTATGRPVDEAVARLSAGRVTILAVGLGTEKGAAMSVNRFASDSAGAAAGREQIRVTQLDRRSLERLARATGGQYYDGTDQRTPTRLVAQLRAPTARFARAGAVGWLLPLLLTAAFVCLSSEWLLGVLGRRDT
jgi:Mg-chelatase subunit ChlD